MTCPTIVNNFSGDDMDNAYQEYFYPLTKKARSGYIDPNSKNKFDPIIIKYCEHLET